MLGYLSYRRDGGENHSHAGRISLAVTQRLLNGETGAATSLSKNCQPIPAQRDSSLSSAPSKPSSPAAATAPSPTRRIWTTRWPLKSCS